MHKKSKSNNPCAICGRQVKPTTITHEERRGDRLYLFQNVPAQVCGACGEIWIDEAVLQRLTSSLKAGSLSAKYRRLCSIWLLITDARSYSTIMRTKNYIDTIAPAPKWLKDIQAASKRRAVQIS